MLLVRHSLVSFPLVGRFRPTRRRFAQESSHVRFEKHNRPWDASRRESAAGTSSGTLRAPSARSSGTRTSGGSRARGRRRSSRTGPTASRSRSSRTATAAPPRSGSSGSSGSSPPRSLRRSRSVLGDRYRRERVIVVAELTRAVLLAATTRGRRPGGPAGRRLRPCGAGGHRVLRRAPGAGGAASVRCEDAAGADRRQRHLEHDREPRDLRRPRDRRRCSSRRPASRSSSAPRRQLSFSPRCSSAASGSRRSPSRASSERGSGSEFTAGFVTLFREPGLRVLVALLAAQTFVAGALNVLHRRHRAPAARSRRGGCRLPQLGGGDRRPGRRGGLGRR